MGVLLAVACQVAAVLPAALQHVYGAVAFVLLLSIELGEDVIEGAGGAGFACETRWRSEWPRRSGRTRSLCIRDRGYSHCLIPPLRNTVSTRPSRALHVVPRVLTECVLLPVSLASCADRRALQTEVCGPARRTRPIAALVYVSADVAVVVKRLDQASVSIRGWLAC